MKQLYLMHLRYVLLGTENKLLVLHTSPIRTREEKGFTKIIELFYQYEHICTST